MVNGTQKIFSGVEKIFSVTENMVKIDRRAKSNVDNGLAML